MMWSETVTLSYPSSSARCAAAIIVLASPQRWYGQSQSENRMGARLAREALLDERADRHDGAGVVPVHEPPDVLHADEPPDAEHEVGELGRREPLLQHREHLVEIPPLDRGDHERLGQLDTLFELGVERP